MVYVQIAAPHQHRANVHRGIRASGPGAPTLTRKPPDKKQTGPGTRTTLHLAVSGPKLLSVVSAPALSISPSELALSLHSTLSCRCAKRLVCAGVFTPQTSARSKRPCSVLVGFWSFGGTGREATK